MTSSSDIDRRFRRFRVQEVVTMTLVYAIFYILLAHRLEGQTEGLMDTLGD